jgi:hypothetical protein
MDPAEAWRQWYEIGSKMWADVLEGSRGWRPLAKG